MLGGIGQGLSSLKGRGDHIVTKSITDLLGVGGRLDAGGIELVKLGHVLEDGVELTSHGGHFVICKMQPGKPGNIFYFLFCNFHVLYRKPKRDTLTFSPIKGCHRERTLCCLLFIQ